MPLVNSNASSRTLTIGARQFVVHEAFEIILWVAGSRSSSFTPRTIETSGSPIGAETTTYFAPAVKCLLAFSWLLNTPVDSITTSTPSSAQGRFSGSLSEKTLNRSPSTTMSPSTTDTSPGYVPCTESYLRRWAFISTAPRSLIATMSIPPNAEVIALHVLAIVAVSDTSTPDSALRRSVPTEPPFAARKKFLPIRPNPLIATFMLGS